MIGQTLSHGEPKFHPDDQEKADLSWLSMTKSHITEITETSGNKKLIKKTEQEIIDEQLEGLNAAWIIISLKEEALKEARKNIEY
ncbi:10732_t:CDS:2 [Funneliformis geosporum]|nr:10732_t:CDS:2 [Funneliformis geosporum]